MGYTKPVCNEVVAANVMVACSTVLSCPRDLRTQDNLAGSYSRVLFVALSNPAFNGNLDLPIPAARSPGCVHCPAS